MSISDEIRKLQELHETGVLSDEEFAQAKARVIAGQDEPESPPALEGHFERLHLQNDLERIDREWQIERQRYITRNRYRGDGDYDSLSPEQSNSPGGVIGMVIVAICAIGFVVFWIGGASSIGAPPIFPIFGIFFIVVIIASLISGISRAGRYQSAYDQYRQRREEVLAKLKEQDRKQAR